MVFDTSGKFWPETEDFSFNRAETDAGDNVDKISPAQISAATFVA